MKFITKNDLTTYDCETLKKFINKLLVKHHDLIYLKYIYYSRKYGYYKKHKTTVFNKAKFIYFRRKQNKLSTKYNLDFDASNIGKNLKIYHPNIVINPFSKIGDNCQLHGNNCIGNNGKDDYAPIIGNNVNIGYGAIIIGNITIEDNVTIGANCIITKSIKEKNVTVIGTNKIIRNKSK